MNPNETTVSLKRALSRLSITFYGVGTMLGAGIYVLVGKVASHAGVYTPLAFLLASIIAMFTAVTYAELSSRFPKSAGEAYYVLKAHHRHWLSMLVGWLVVFTGLVSAAAITKGFVGYLQIFIHVPPWLALVCVVVSMAGIAIWGIEASAMTVFIITIIEISGLLIIIVLASDQMNQLPTLWHQAPLLDKSCITGILSGAFLAFYAYIGFEDMVNVAEEIKQPEKNLPPAIFWAMGIATVLYVMVALALLLALPIEALGASHAPLATFIESKGFSPQWIAFISLVAIINGALAQVVMASRVLYGMAKQHGAPRWFALVHPRTQTPIASTLFVTLIILILTLWFNIEALANLTSTIIIVVFIMIHSALIRIKWRHEIDDKAVSYSIAFPILGMFLSFLFLFVPFLLH